jgi:hypothetical protein
MSMKTAELMFPCFFLLFIPSAYFMHERKITSCWSQNSVRLFRWKFSWRFFENLGSEQVDSKGMNGKKYKAQDVQLYKKHIYELPRLVIYTLYT